MKLLKEMHKESKIRESWRMQWIHSFCQLNHCRSHTQSPQEQVLTMLKTITLLGN